MRTSIKIGIVLWSVALLILSGCTKEITGLDGNQAPVLLSALTDLSIEVNSSITVSLKHLEAYDDDGDVMQVIVGDGDNYTITAGVLTPTENFIGDLFVPVKLFDGENYSVQKIIIVSVVRSVELFPLLNGSWWEYSDSVIANDSTYKTRLEATFLRDSIIDGVSEAVHCLQWSNLAALGICYEAYTSNEGTILLGGTSTHDTLYAPQLFYRYPIVQGDYWSNQKFNYNVTDSLFYLGDASTIRCTNTSVYVTVPAGIFECIEMTVTTAATTRNSDELMLGNGTAVRAGSAVVEKLYYSPGVGYVKSVMTAGESLVWLKELTSYHVEEEQ